MRENKIRINISHDPRDGESAKVLEKLMKIENKVGSDEYIISTVEKDEIGRAVAHAPIDKADGKYDCKIVTESIHPIKFLFE